MPTLTPQDTRRIFMRDITAGFITGLIVTIIALVMAALALGVVGI